MSVFSTAPFKSKTYKNYSKMLLYYITIASSSPARCERSPLQASFLQNKETREIWSPQLKIRSLLFSSSNELQMYARTKNMNPEV
jgi:hypothetical protein